MSDDVDIAGLPVISSEESARRAIAGLRRRGGPTLEERIRTAYFVEHASIESLAERSGLRRHDVVAILRPHDTGGPSCSSPPL